jgi:selenoprotein W-related protein
VATPVKIAITYCAECGYEPQTIALANALMIQFGNQLSSIELIPWDEGAFDVRVGGELVHSMSRDGGFPAEEIVIAAVKQKLEQS